MLDQNKYIWDEFKGLWYRGFNLGDYYNSKIEEIPEGYSFACQNIIFSNANVQNRPPWIFSLQFTPGPVIGFIFPSGSVISGVFPYIIITYIAGDLYFNNSLIIAGFSSGSGSIANPITVLRLPIAPSPAITYSHLICGNNRVIVTDGTMSSAVRDAAGSPPATSITAATGAAGKVELGLHLISVVYETDTGFITKWATPTQYTSPGAVKVNLTTIPTGPTGTIARQIVATKIIRNFNGDVNAYEFFFVPGGRIANNTATSLTIDFYDTELVSSADYLLDISSSLGGYKVLCTYSGRAIYYSPLTNSCVASEVANFETINLVDDVLNIKKVITAWAYEGTLYINTSGGTYGFRDNGGPPNTWEKFLIDSDIVCLGPWSVPRSMDGETSVIDGNVLVMAESGIYAFNGRFSIPLTYPIKALYLNILDNTSGNKKDVLSIMVDNKSKSFIVTGFSGPYAGTMLYCDYSNGIDNKSVRWSTWVYPRSDLTISCPPIIGQGYPFVIANGKTIYKLADPTEGVNVDEDNFTGSIVKSGIYCFISSPMLKMSEDYSTVNISDIRVVSSIQNNSPNTQITYSVGLQFASYMRTYTFKPGDSIINTFNFNKKFERDVLVWSFVTQETPSVGYKVVRLAKIIAYWSLVAQSQIKK